MHGAALIATASLTIAPDGGAQTGTGVIAGRVLEAGSRVPIRDALVAVQGTELRANSDIEGRFRLTGVNGTDVTLSVRRLGFAQATQPARVGDQAVVITLEPTATQLDQLVVTGTAGAVEKRAVGNAVSTIDASDLVRVSPPPDMSNLLNAKAPGVVVLQGSGAVGSGARVKIRGPSSIALNDQPLLYVDGVRINNDQGTGISVQGFGSGIVSRLNDLDPENIESIEIIKGPAAATLYGTEANNGVIQIVTKRGREGRATFTSTIKHGANWFLDAADRIGTLYAQDDDGNVISWNAVDAEEARGTPIFRTGRTTNYHLGVSGGSSLVRYNVSGSLDRSTGIEVTNDLRRYTGAVNLGITPRPSLDVTSSLNITGSDVNLPLEGGVGVLPNISFGSPLTVGTSRRGFSGAPPEAIYDVVQASQKLNRFTGSVRASHTPFSWLTHRLTAGIDLAGQDDKQLNRVPTTRAREFFSSPADLAGSKFVSRSDLATTTIDYGATATRALGSSLTSTSSVGGQYFRRRSYFLVASGEGFPAAGLETIDATTSNFGAGEDLVTNVTVGVYVQQQFDWKNRVFLTGALRADDNSAFGSNFDYVTYPKVSLSWLISEEPFFRLPYVGAIKLRAAYGETGQQPDAFAALRTYLPATGGNGQSAVTPSSSGNPDLEPERGEEIELGFDAELFGDRLGIEVTHYNQKTTGALMPREVQPSLGFPGTRLENTGEVKNSGIEIQVRGRPVRTERVQLDVTWNHAENKNEVVSLGGPTSVQVVQVFGAPRADHLHVVGYPMGANWARRIVSADLDANGRAINQICDNGQGGTTPCFDANGSPAAPRVYLGRTTPPIEGSFSSSLTLWSRLRLYGLLDYKANYRITQNDARARCQIFITCLRNIYPERYDPATIAEDQTSGGAGFRSNFIEDASFLKLREISAQYTLPTRLVQPFGASAASFTLSARNLHTWTKYTGIDPEAFFVAERFVRVTQSQTPQLSQLLGTINLTF